MCCVTFQRRMGRSLNRECYVCMWQLIQCQRNLIVCKPLEGRTYCRVFCSLDQSSVGFSSFIADGYDVNI